MTEKTAAPAVSVVLPVYNARDTVADAVFGLLTGTASEVEIVAVDDGSEDDSAALLAGLSAADRRVRLLRHPDNRGIVAALHTGLAAARGRYIARMDADDTCLPGRLAVQRAYLDAHPDIGLVGCRVAFGGDRRRQAGYAAYVDWTNTLTDPESIALNRFVESPFAHPSVMFRAELPGRHGSYRDGPFPEDYDLWLRWLGEGVAMAKVPETLLCWNDPPERLSRTHPNYSRDAFYACKAGYLAAWLKRANPRHPDLVVWGAGRDTRKRAEHLTAHGVVIAAYVDVDPRKIGQVVHGRPVLAPEELPAPGGCFVAPFVGSRGARKDIRGRLRARGYVEGVHFIMAA